MTSQFQHNYSVNFRSVIRWKNTSGYTVPPYGVVQADSYDPTGFYYSIVRPTAEGELFFINGEIPVPDGSFGTSLPWDGNAIPALFAEYNHTFASGADIIPDEWKLGEGNRYRLVSNIQTDGTNYVGSVLEIGGGGGGGGIVMFEITVADVYCKDYVTAVVVGGVCDGEPTLNDELQVFDEAGCFFDLPNDEFQGLVGIRGFAAQLELLPVAAEGECPEKPACRWVVIQLCCLDIIL